MKSKYQRKQVEKKARAERYHGGGKHAKPRHKLETKAEAKLMRRVRDYSQMMADTKRPMDGKKMMRLESGGYHRPGSMK